MTQAPSERPAPLDPTVAEALDDAVAEAFERAQVPFLRELVDLPSASREVDDVEAVMRRLDAEAAAVGLSSRVVPPGDHEVASHRVLSTPTAHEDANALALVGHADTVFPRALGFFGLRREGDRAMGPGVLDMKSGLSEVLYALRAVRAAAPDAWARLRARVVVVSDEEIGSPSSSALYASLAPRTPLALVFEAGRMHDRVVTARKGGGLYTLRAIGRAAHAGNRHADGVNAIHAIACAVLRLEALTDYASGLTVSVGLIEGGTAKNTVPEHAEIGVDVRFTSAKDVARFRDALARIGEDPFEGIDARWINDRVLRARVEISGGVTRPPMEPTEATQALRRRYEEHARAVGLGGGEAPLQGGGSDANLLAAAGVPCIDGLGPFGEFFHETREWCSLASLRRRTAALARFLTAEATASVL
ncbi:MAG: M20 family metallopeptidase [Sandaracinaceae bacterium]